MKFEHLIEINDPLNPLIDALTLEHRWRGLVLRAIGERGDAPAARDGGQRAIPRHPP